MTFQTQQSQHATPLNAAVGDGLLWIGVLAAGGSCGALLAQGVVAGWSLARIVVYVLLTLLLLGLVLGQRFSWRATDWIVRHARAYVLASGATCFALHIISGDPFIQPIVFTVPLVSAVLCYPPPRAAVVGAVYLALQMLGLWLGGVSDIAVLLASLGTYAFVMLTLGTFTYQAAQQAAARAEAAELAATLERERDHLARLVAENERLSAQAQHAATLAERNRLARELHDTIAQGLTAVTMQLEAAQRSFDRDATRTRARLSRAHDLARDTLDDVRRSVWTLAEPLVEAADLAATLDETARQFQASTGIPTCYEHTGPPPALGSAAATQVLRIVREALQNVEKHAQASSVVIASQHDDIALTVCVGDDGVGFAPEPAANGSGGFGLLSLHERARLAGGTLAVTSMPGAGTRVAVTIPTG